MLNSLPRNRKIIFSLTIIVIVIIVILITITTISGQDGPLSPNVAIALSTAVTLGLGLLQVIPVMMDILKPKITDQEIENALSELAQAQTLVKQNEFKKAVEKATSVTKVLPRKAEAYRVRAEAYSSLGQLASAINDLSMAIELEPGFPFGYSQRASLFRDIGEHRKAIDDWEKGILIAPELPSQIFQLALMYFLVGEFEQAAKLFQDVLKHPKISHKEKDTSREFIERANNLIQAANQRSQ